jgi:hypothetical protein
MDKENKIHGKGIFAFNELKYTVCYKELIKNDKYI